jgi:hypothetical protein
MDIQGFVLEQLVVWLGGQMQASPIMALVIGTGLYCLHGIWTGLLTYNSNRSRVAPATKFEYGLGRLLSSGLGKKIDGLLLYFNRRLTVKGRVRDGLAKKNPENSAANYTWD